MAGGIAALAVAAFLVYNNQSQETPVRLASSATILTPGAQTGFSEPTITWKTDHPAPVRIVIEDTASGAKVAEVNDAFSPLPFRRIGGTLKPNISYRILIQSDPQTKNEIAQSTFTISHQSEGAPTRDSTVEGVVKQCENLIAANRHADAWMLWAELTSSEKSDPRMQDLKVKILEKIKS